MTGTAMTATAAPRVTRPADGPRPASAVGSRAARAPGSRAARATGARPSTRTSTSAPSTPEMAPPGSPVVTARILRSETAEDEVLSQVLRGLQGEEVETDRNPELKYYLDQKQFLFVEDGILKRRTLDDDRVPQIVVPAAMRDRVLCLAHDVAAAGHFGVDRTLKRITGSNTLQRSVYHLLGVFTGTM